MIFLLYSSHDEDNIKDSLGMADYSYFFVMKRYLPMLAELGTVEVLSEEATDELIASYPLSDELVYLSFTPPDKVAPVTLCPVVVVFAWEFSTIPYESFTREEDNWVGRLEVLGRAITHSSYAVGVVRNQLGENFDIESIPAPLWDACESSRSSRRALPPQGLAGIELGCRAIDSASYELSNTFVRPKTIESDFRISPLGHEWDGEIIDLSFCGVSSESSLIGFNKPEEWGVWSKPGYPWLLLNELITGHIELKMTAQGYAQNVGERLQIQFGTASADFLLTEHPTTQIFELHLLHPTNVIAFMGVIDKALGMVDPRDIGFGLVSLSVRRIDAPPINPAPMHLDLSDPGLILDGFHTDEPAGRWTAKASCSIYLPKSVRGDVSISFTIPYRMHNAGRVLELTLGGCTRSLSLGEAQEHYDVHFSNASATNDLRIDKLVPGPTGNDEDPREIGIFISEVSLAIEHPEMDSPANLAGVNSETATVENSVLYTTILNPMDARKNWEDLITAFVYAFRDKSNVTLLMKITHHDFGSFFEDIFTFFTELYPFECRLIFIHGFLAEKEFAQLIEHSHYIVNASTGEGQCLPLMEFMSSGVPAIAPCHSAMLDYVNPANTFVIDSSAEPTCWPQDPRYVFRAQSQRINWQSLRDALVESERVFRRSPDRYAMMSQASIDSLEQYCSLKVAGDKFGEFLERITGPGAAA